MSGTGYYETLLYSNEIEFIRNMLPTGYTLINSSKSIRPKQSKPTVLFDDLGSS